MVPDSVTSCPSALADDDQPGQHARRTAIASGGQRGHDEHPERLHADQPQPPDRGEQQPAQRAVRGLAGDRVGRGHRHGQRQQQGQRERHRRDRQHQPVAGDAPIRPGPGSAASATATPIAISTGISANTPSITSVRGRRSTQRSSEPSSRPERGAARGAGRRTPASAGVGHAGSSVSRANSSSRLARLRRASCTATPARTSSAIDLRRRRPVVADHDRRSGRRSAR